MLIKQGKSNIKYLLIVVVLAALVGSFIWWQYGEIRKEETNIPELEMPEKEEKLVIPKEAEEIKGGNEDEIVVGLDQYHAYQNTWEKWKIENVRGYPEGPAPGEKFIKYLNEEGIKTKIIKSRLNSEILEDIDVLIITNLYEPVSSREKEELKKFLDEGGGLLLAGGTVYVRHIEILDDLIESLHFNVKFNSDCNVPPRFTKEISEHQITSNLESIVFHGCSFDSNIPLTPLIKKGDLVFYAIQHYAKGKVGIVGHYKMIIGIGTSEFCRQCSELNLNLIKWLAAPEIYEEMG